MRQSKFKLFQTIIAGVILSVGGYANAATSFSFNNGITSVATLTLTEVLGGTGTQFKLTANQGLGVGSFIKSLKFNYIGATPFNLSWFSASSDPTSQRIQSFSSNNRNDRLKLFYPTSNSGGGSERFLDGDFSIWTIANTSFSDFAIGGDNATLHIANKLSAVPAIPEAEEWAMMIIGLCMIGFMLRKGKSTQEEFYPALTA